MSIIRDDEEEAIEFTGKRDIPPIHPGEVLLTEFMEPLGISQSRLAADVGVSFRRIHEITHGKRGITADTAILLSAYFGNSAQFWLNLQTRHDLLTAREKMAGQVARVRKLEKMAK